MSSSLDLPSHFLNIQLPRIGNEGDRKMYKWNKINMINMRPLSGSLWCKAVLQHLCRYIQKDTFVEVGKSSISPTFDQVLESLLANGEYLAFAPNTSDTRMMINILSYKFPLMQVWWTDNFAFVFYLCLIFFNDLVDCSYAF